MQLLFNRAGWIFSEYLSQKQNLIVFICGVTVSHVLAIIPPMISMSIVDKVIVSASTSSLIVVITILLVVNLFTNILGSVGKSLYSRTGLTITSNIAERINNHLFHLPADFFKMSSVGDNLAKLNEIDKLKGFIDSWLISRSIELFFSVFYVAFMFWLSPGLAMIALSIIPINASIYALSNKPARQAVQRQYEKSKNYQSYLIEALNSIEVVKSHGVERVFVDTLKNKFKDYVSEIDVINHIDIKVGLSLSIIATIVECISMYYGAMQVIHYSMTLGALFAFQLISGRAIQPLQASTSFIHEYNEAKNALERVSDITNEVPEKYREFNLSLDAEDHIDEIVLSDVKVISNQDGRDLLSVKNLKINIGERIFVTGPSGAGKSTFAKLLSGLIFPSNGNISIKIGSMIKEMSSDLRPLILYIPQTPSIFKGTIMENITLFDKTVPISKCLDALKIVGLAMDDYDAQAYLNYNVDEGGSNLSGGQRQRIALARAFITPNSVVIYDESTSSLDTKSEDEIIKNILVDNRLKTVVMISHRVNLASNFDRVICIENGEVAFDDIYQEFMKIHSFTSNT